MKQIILASTSPRRREILEKTRIKFKVVASDYEEDMNLKLNPKELAKELSCGKARAVIKKYKNAIIIGADTFVVLNNKLLGKPHTTEEAKKMLRKVSGKTLSIISGLTVIDSSNGKKISKATETKVYIKKLTTSEIDDYVASKEPLDKAGAFAIQDLGSTFIKRIEGDYLNAIGLSLYELAKVLNKFNVNILG